MGKLFMLMGSSLVLSLCLNCSASLASNNMQKNDEAMDITSPPKHLISKENKIEFDDEEINKFPENKKIEESKKIEEDVTSEDLRKEQASKAASERVKKLLGLNQPNTGGRTKHNAY
jgi:hypothetical protein